MKITSQILSIPPYLSTRWDYIQSLRVQDKALLVTLQSGPPCSIPGLTEEEISQIFTGFATYAHHPKEETKSDELLKKDLSQLVEGVKKGVSEFVSLLSKLGGHSLGFAKALEHDPANAHLPPLPPEIVGRIEMLLQIVSEEDILAMPEPESDCNCMYCQVQRILRTALEKKKERGENEEEPVDESELKFNEWTVEQSEDKIYIVRNKLNPQEEYRVFLGEPLGCTCGKANCEHIIAVLRS